MVTSPDVNCKMLYGCVKRAKKGQNRFLKKAQKCPKYKRLLTGPNWFLIKAQRGLKQVSKKGPIKAQKRQKTNGLEYCIYKRSPNRFFLKKTQCPKTENGVKPCTKPTISNYFGQFR